MSNYRKRISAALCALAFAVSCIGSVSAAAVDEFSGDTVSDSVVLLASGDVAINESNFPDATFRQYVSDNFDTDNSGILSQEELDAVTEINVKGTYETPNTITSLKGIEYFTKLEKLYCSFNNLKSLDVSDNTALTKLDCNDNKLATLNVSNNTALTELDCANNQLTSLDVSKNTALTELDCAINQLTTLDVRNNTALTEFYCNFNMLISLNVSKNTALTRFSCNNNQLKSLDVSNNTALTYLNCSSNQLITLDVSKNTALKKLSCHYNQLTTLDVSKNTALAELNCYYNQLTSLDVSGNTVLYSLYCNNNQLTTLDANNNPALIWLECSNNLFTNLDLSKITALTLLYCENNQLTSLDVSKNTALAELYCNDNHLTSLDVSKNTVLIKLLFNNNQLTTIDVSKNTKLHTLQCSNNQLTNLDVSNNIDLQILQCDNNQLANLDVSKNTGLYNLYCNSNRLTNLDVSENTGLSGLYCHYNQLTSLDVSKNIYLYSLSCNNNRLTSLDLSNNTELKKFNLLNNTYPIGDVIGSYSLDNLPAGFDPTKASNWTGADYDAATNSLKNFTTNTVTYDYDCGYGDPVTFTLTASSYTAPTPEKTVPVLNVTPVSGGAEVTWDAIPGASMYWLYVFGTNGLVTETPVFGTNAAVTGLTPGQSYGFVAISCINGAWDFNWTAEDLAYAFIPPEKTVPKLNVTSISGGVNVSWDAVPGAGMYWLYVFGDNGLVTETPVFGTSQTVMGLTPGQGYAFVAISYINGAWDFNWTADDLVYAFVPPERTVPVLNVTPVSGGANVSWDAVPGADMYWLYVFGSNGLVTEMPVYSIYGTSTTVIGLTSGQGYAFVAISYINGAWDFNWTANDLVYAIAG